MNKIFDFILQGKIHSKHKCNTSCFWDLNSWLFQKMFCWILRHFKDWFCRKLSLLLDLVDVGNGLELWRWFVVSLITCACVLAATVQRPYHFSPVMAISHFWLISVRLLKSGSLEVIVAARRNLVHFLKDFSFPSMHWVVSFCTFSSPHIIMFLSLSDFMYMPFLLWTSFYLDW